MALTSYSSDTDILWETQTSTLLNRESIYYADRAILNDGGDFFIIDHATLTVHYRMFNQTYFSNDIKNEYDTNMDCTNEKYDYVNKIYGFYATYIAYYNCVNNHYAFNKTTPCIAYKYCPGVQHYENVFLQPSSSQTSCRKYLSNHWRQISNNYILFQVSIANTLEISNPELYLVLSTSNKIQFAREFDEKYLDQRTLLITIYPLFHAISLTTKYYNETFYISTLFKNTQVEYISIVWEPNFDRISIGNSKYISKP
eukprot:180406_1